MEKVEKFTSIWILGCTLLNNQLKGKSESIETNENEKRHTKIYELQMSILREIDLKWII